MLKKKILKLKLTNFWDKRNRRRQGKGEAGKNRKCYQKSKLEWVSLGIKASKDRKKKISDVQANGGVKSEKNVIYQGGMKDVRGSLQAPERVEGWRSPTPRASAGPDGAIIGSRDSRGWVEPRRRCPGKAEAWSGWGGWGDWKRFGVLKKRAELSSAGGCLLKRGGGAPGSRDGESRCGGCF